MHYNLREGIIERYELEEDEEVSYKFSLDSNEKIVKVQFHITSISGNAILLVSRINKYPTINDREL